MQRTIGCSTPESKLVENPTVDEPTSNSLLKSSGSVKQEVNKAQRASFDILLVCLIRCDQVKKEDFTQKTNEIENMVEFNQKQMEKLQTENDSLRMHIEVIREQLRMK